MYPKVLSPYCETQDSLGFQRLQKGRRSLRHQFNRRQTFTRIFWRPYQAFGGTTRSGTLGQGSERGRRSGTRRNPQRRQPIDQTVEWALPESTNTDEALRTVEALITTDHSSEHMERHVLQGSHFPDRAINPNGLHADATRVSGYIDQLDKFDAKDIALICVPNTIFT